VSRQAKAVVDRLETAMNEFKPHFYNIKTQLTAVVQSKDKDQQRRYAEFHAPDRQGDIEPTKLGLADRFRNIDGYKMTEEDIQMVKDFLPPVIEPENLGLRDIPKDLFERIDDVITAFEEDLHKLDMDEKHKLWYHASASEHYDNALTAAWVMRDTAAMKRLLGSIMPCFAEVWPGSFRHQKLAVQHWESAIDSLDPGFDLHNKGVDVAPEEKAVSREILRLRYGDLSPAEEERALLRLAMTREPIDENWFWDVSWCLGRAPPRIADKGDDSLDQGKKYLIPPDMSQKAPERSSMW